jgi:ABC-type nickel/cobalt efflux system permease component RcnA
MLFSAIGYKNYQKIKSKVKSIKERYNDDDDNAKEAKKFLGMGLALFLILVVLDLILIILGIYFTWKCARAKKYPIWVAILLTILISIFPGPVALVMIIYGVIACGKGKGKK